jgi:hypothetical protein
MSRQKYVITRNKQYFGVHIFLTKKEDVAHAAFIGSLAFARSLSNEGNVAGSSYPQGATAVIHIHGEVPNEYRRLHVCSAEGAVPPCLWVVRSEEEIAPAVENLEAIILDLEPIYKVRPELTIVGIVGCRCKDIGHVKVLKIERHALPLHPHFASYALADVAHLNRVSARL